tara:strand:- start:9254 stop:9628 length:375 start_codon:yes stop_codon:yes gene_type:complete
MIKRVLAAIAVCLISPCFAHAEIHTSYFNAYTASQADKKTFVIVIGASWCPPCKKMESMIEANPHVAEQGHLVILDYKAADVSKLYSGSSVPAIVRFKWEGEKWVKTTIIGGQSYSQLKRFING